MTAVALPMHGRMKSYPDVEFRANLAGFWTMPNNKLLKLIPLYQPKRRVPRKTSPESNVNSYAACLTCENDYSSKWYN
jgi:hypothetical protein